MFFSCENTKQKPGICLKKKKSLPALDVMKTN